MPPGPICNPGRDAIARCLDRVADDDDLTVVLLRGAGGVFSTGADMNNAYGWYGASRAESEADDRKANRRPSQRRRLTLDRKSFGFYHNFMGFPKVTVGEIAGYALGGGFEMALMTDISVIARDTKIGMPATRFLGPALGLGERLRDRIEVVEAKLAGGADEWAALLPAVGHRDEVRRRGKLEVDFE